MRGIIMRKRIPGFPDYFISEDSEVFSTLSTGPRTKNRKRKFLQLKPTLSGAGYYIVELVRTDGTQKILLLHRLLAATFIGDIEGKIVRHLNDTPTDNRLENLTIGTQKENIADSIRNGSRYSTAKVVYQMDVGGGFSKSGRVLLKQA